MRIAPRVNSPATVTAFIMAVAVGGCGDLGDKQEREEPDRKSVFASIVPVEYFARRIGGRHIETHSLVGPGGSPATYEPTTKKLALLARAEAFFIVGVPMEASLVPRIRTNFESVEIVDVRDGIRLMRPEVGSQSLEGARASPNHHHEIDPHVWLSPRNAGIIAWNICESLVRIDPENAFDYADNLRDLLADLGSMDARIAKLLAPYQGQELLVFHPAYGYFAQEYGMKQVAIEEGGVTPGSRRLARLIESARAQGVTAVFVQPQFSSAAAETVADAIGADVIELDPLAPDYLENLWDMAIKIQSTCVNG
jgi:zinc transport system substrate-binding protein